MSLPLTQECLRKLDRQVPELEHGLRGLDEWKTYVVRDAEITAYVDIISKIRAPWEMK